MSKPIAAPPHIANLSPIQVATISTSANPHSPSAGVLKDATPADDAGAPYRRTLKALDQHFGPLRIGEVMASRVELQALGAKVNGQPINTANAGMQRADQRFIDGLNFNADRVQARLRSVDIADSGEAAMLFYEIACKRSIDATPLFVADTTIDPGSAMDRLNQLGKAVQKLDIHRTDALENAPGWISKNKSYLMSGAGVGMQAFGIYSGYIAMIDAIKHGDTLEAVFQGGSIAAEFGSLIIERGLTKTGEAMLRNGGTALKYFPLTSVGKYMSRGAGMFASAITLPFDIADAIKSFNAAATAQGKEAQDHYVNGSLSVAGAGISLILGVAALAGFGSTAGPVGLVAAGLLIAASMIYQAARVVDDIDDYIELTFEERLRSGWFAFTNKELDKDVLDRFKIAKGYRDHQQQLELSAKDMLEGAYKHSIEHVINGAFQVELKPVEIWRYQWDESAGEQPFKLDSQAVVVGGDDVIDAGDGLPASLNGKVSGSAGDNKGVFWRLGDGNDRVIGVRDKPNLFTYRADHKALTGGDRNDAFYQDITEQELNRTGKPAHLNVLDGGAGSDTLAFEGSRPLSDTRQVGHDISLHSGRVLLRALDPAVNAIEVAHLTSIENVSTLRQGTSRIEGNDEPNQISAHGSDSISAGAGDDTIALYGVDCRVEGGSGADRYYIANTNVRTTIVEDGEQSSLIEFGWPADIIQRWQILGTSLVIRSLRGEDGNDPEHVLTLENVYQRIDGKRQLKNDRFRFKTQDGYELLAQLPKQLDDVPSQDIKPAVVVIGQPAPAPQIVNGGTVEIVEQGLKQHFVCRTDRQVEFVARHNTAKTSRIVYLEFDNTEIIDVQVSYDVQVREGVSGNTHLYYKDFTLSVRLPSKVVMFKGIVQPIAAATGYSGRNSLKVTTPYLQQNIVLIMQDQVSYRLQVPELDYEDDAKSPGLRVRSTRSCLKQRNGNYRFVRSLVSAKPSITAQPSRITIDKGPHTGIYVLEGQSSTYDVHLASNTIIRLSTPGATAKTADASTWTLYTRAMEETVTRDDMQLDGKRLRIASVTIELPEIDNDAPVESISVATSSGNIYEISLLFEVLQLYVIDASAYASVEALLAEINAHQQRNELATRVHVTHIGIKAKTVSTVVYNSVHKYWSLDSDPQARINPQDLVFSSNRT
ncbi:Calcium-binding protein [Pseudomonas sp. IT-347P]|uniref:calcium-binding protein n=1 Tax=Pseudomonas sp. IT-347P TaxID=3026458 RepID=UPI0039E0B37E